MEGFEDLCFSDTQDVDRAVKVSIGKPLVYYADILHKYCEDNEIDFYGLSDDYYSGAVEIMSIHGSAVPEPDYYWFWID